MTDSDSEPLDHLDDLASALLDGEVDHRAAIGALDDAMRARLEDRISEFSRLRDRVMDLPDPPPDDVRDDMISRAISVSAARSEASRPVTDAPMAPVRSLDRHRERRAARLRRLAPALVAAAVLLLGAVVVPSLLEEGEDDLAFTAADEGADTAETRDDGDTEDAAVPAPTTPTANALGDPTEAIEEGEAEAEAATESDDAPDPNVAAPAPADEQAGAFAYEGSSDEDLLDAVIRYRASAATTDQVLGLQSLRAACGDVIRHPADLVVEGSYRAQDALFVADVDGSAVLAVTVLSPSCAILDQVSSN